MPQSGPDTANNPTLTATSIDQVDRAWESRQLEGSQTTPNDIEELVSPLLGSLSQALDGVPVALALPWTLAAEALPYREAPVLCILPADGRKHPEADSLGRIALEARGQASRFGGADGYL